MKKKLMAVAFGTATLAAAALGGAVIAGAASPGSATTGTTTTTPAGPAFPAHGSASHEGAENAVTGTAADKAKAAAVKSVGGGSAGDVTTDYPGSGYEVTVTKSDGSTVEVHLDGSFSVVQGGPGPHGPAHGSSPHTRTPRSP